MFIFFATNVLKANIEWFELLSKANTLIQFENKVSNIEMTLYSTCSIRCLTIQYPLLFFSDFKYTHASSKISG